jgi:endoglycosylceramidase
MKNFILWVASSFLSLFKPAKVSKWIRDSDGRIVIYHGLNISNNAKRSPNFISWHTKKDFIRMRDWGFNSVRYLMFWEAIEPVKGQINTEYLNASVEKIKEMGKCGLDVIVDIHQDLYSKKFTGNGFPSWTENDGGHPFTQQTPWNLNYLQRPVIACYTNFWKNATLQKAYVDMLCVVLKAVDPLPNVVGIDVMNEPFPGALLLFEEKYLTTLYTKLLKVFKGTTKKMFFEPWMSTSSGLPTDLKFKPDSSCVYAPHYYDAFCHEGSDYLDSNQKFMRSALEYKVLEAQRFNVPMWFGEFGVGVRVNGYLQYLKDFCSLANEYGFSWSYYSYDISDDGGFGLITKDFEELPPLKILSQIYPQRIAGEDPKFMDDGKKFTLTYTATILQKPTIIFIPASKQNIIVMVDGILAEEQPIGKPFIYNSPAVGAKKIEVLYE